MTLNDFRLSPSLAHCMVDNMSRTGLYDCHIFFIFFDDFKRNSNFGIGVLHVKVKIDVFFVTSIPCSLEFLLFHRIEYPKSCLEKKRKFFYGSVL